MELRKTLVRSLASAAAHYVRSGWEDRITEREAESRKLMGIRLRDDADQIRDGEDGWQLGSQ